MLPTVELADVKAHLQVEHGEDDSLISSYIDAAIATVLAQINLGEVLEEEQTEDWFGECIKLPLPIATVTSINQLDGETVGAAVDSADYAITMRNQSPIVTVSETGASGRWYRIVYDPGFAITPPWLKQAVKFIVAHFYANRESVVAAPGIAAAELPQTFEFLIAPHRRVWFA